MTLPKVLDGNTLVPLSLVVTICGCIFWLAVLWAGQSASAQEIKEIKMTQAELSERIVRQNIEMIDRLGRIEQHLKDLN